MLLSSLVVVNVGRAVVIFDCRDEESEEAPKCKSSPILRRTYPGPWVLGYVEGCFQILNFRLPHNVHAADEAWFYNMSDFVDVLLLTESPSFPFGGPCVAM